MNGNLGRREGKISRERRILQPSIGHELRWDLVDSARGAAGAARLARTQELGRTSPVDALATLR